MEVVDIVSVTLILQTRYVTPAGCSQAPEHCVTLLTCLLSMLVVNFAYLLEK